MIEREISKAGERIVVIHPIVLKRDPSVIVRSPESALEEAIGLAEAIELNVVHAENINIKNISPGTFLGSGSVDKIHDLVADIDVQLVFVDYALSPIQQRNLEEVWHCKVLDRSALILEIFGARAQTREGGLQVALAALQYQRSRLVKAWSHLERQQGGGGFTGGPGEKQKELDRRMIDDQINRYKRDIESVRKNRETQRQARKREPFPVVALVGYTNAGKSTLFNHITDSKVFAKDLLFATLDTTMRAIRVPSGKKAILSDTVGFISDLPTHLVAAFRATLEDVQDAAVILHVRDIAQENTNVEKKDVESILQGLGIEGDDERIIEVLNKTDLLDESKREEINTRSKKHGHVIPISAVTGEGVGELLEAVDAILCKRQQVVDINIDITDGKAIAWLHEHGQVVARNDDEEFANITISMDPADIDRFSNSFSYKVKAA